MEQHPIPRNISGFQFHLIGDMTLRQFGYLAGGVVCAYFAFKIAPFPTIIRYPLSGFFGLIGFAFAFLPIQERPLDKWLVAFIKSITSPTQFVWVKNNVPSDIFSYAPVRYIQSAQTTQINTHKEAQVKLAAYLSSLPKTTHETFNTREKKYIDATLSLFQTSGAYTNPVIIPPINPAPVINHAVSDNFPKPTFTPTPKNLTDTISPKTVPITSPVLSDSSTVQTIPNPEPAVSSPILQPAIQPTAQPKNGLSTLTKQLEELALQKRQLEEELNRLKQDVTDAQSPQVIKPVNDKNEATLPTIKTVSPKTAINEIGLPTNQYPNIITGVLKDPQRKILPNIILTIKDKNGMPLRALKTNKLGQFATATPLPNGVYLLEAEDPMKRYIFDIAQIVLSGKVYPPIEIIAKGEKEIMREKLTKELFGSGNANI